jgi:dTDP-4-dehydrorhamnose reductase
MHAGTLLITGARGTLGQAFARACEARGLPYELADRQRLDIACPEMGEAVLSELRPWAVINAAGYVRVDDAERDADRCMRENALGALSLAHACKRFEARLLSFSSDLVFDGQGHKPYVESDRPCPLSVYGRSKVQAEQQVTAALDTALMVRTSAFFGPTDSYNFVTQVASSLVQRRPVRAADDTVISPTYVPHLVNACLDLLLQGEAGLWHLANRGAVSWAELAQRVARAIDAPEGLVEPCSFAALDLPAVRPRYSALSSERGSLMPSLEEGLTAYFADTL